MIAILTALAEEAAALRTHLESADMPPIQAWRGDFDGVSVVLALTGVGKVNAAMATQVVVERHHPRALIVAGLAGAIRGGAPGQLIVASGAVQYDVDARPLTRARGEVPGLGTTLLLPDEHVTRALRMAVPSAQLGVVLTGDQIITSSERRDRIAAEFPDGACLDMETAAVAQVALANRVPWGAIRVTSDSADESFNLDQVLGFGTGTAAELFEQVLRRAAGSLLRSS